MNTKRFYEERSKRSEIKTRILEDYFSAWATIMLRKLRNPNGCIAYVDLFAGPGCYDDETKSTPLIILERAIANSELGRRLVTVFNDRKSEFVEALRGNIETIPDIEQLRHYPQVHNYEVGTEIVTLLEAVGDVPTFFFVDPWGYKGLTLDLISSLSRGWGSEFVLFFNYNRIRMGFGNPSVNDPIDKLFGRDRANQLRTVLNESPDDPEKIIMDEFDRALKAIGWKYSHRFPFRDTRSKRTSHMLIYATRSETGYRIMKDVLAKYSSSTEQGVASLDYDPKPNSQLTLPGIDTPLDDLVRMLPVDFSGQRLKMIEVFNRHHVGKRYQLKHYKKALLRLESEGAIRVEPPIGDPHRRSGTFANWVMVEFPPKET